MAVQTRHRFWRRREVVWLVAVAGAAAAGSAVLGTIPTTVLDFFIPGSQPNSLVEVVADSNECMGCHGYFNPVTEPGRNWAATMMGQAARDPVFTAALTIANQDAAFAGDLCLRCHAPGGWVQGRSTPPDGSALTSVDMQGVSCNICHRLVNPVYQQGVSPPEDQQILQNVTVPPHPHSGSYVLDPMDRRRGPYDLGPTFPAHYWLQSPFHTTSNLCATCHDVSNPAFERQADGTYALGPLNAPNRSDDKYNQFPVERTFSEWSQSLFAQGPVDVNHRFGGNLNAVSDCQDCHMPPTEGYGCAFGQFRSDLPTHYFNGGNTWVLKAVRSLFPDSETFLTQDSVTASVDRATQMLQLAADQTLSIVGTNLKVRITNQTGHKLPTGYPEGRRMWINVQFLDGNSQLVQERGAYDQGTGVLTASNTKVYEAKIGVDAAVAAATGIPLGPSFHFAANNLWYSDNRIPPRGFTNAGFASVQAAPVNYSYADGQNWDETTFAIPAGAASARVTLYYQTTSKEYIEFLRDYNTTNTAGLTAYQAWANAGKSTPVAMQTGTILVCYANCDSSSVPPVLNVNDFICFLTRYAGGCP